MTRPRKRHPSADAWGEFSQRDREALTIPTEVWDRIRRPTDAEARAARRRTVLRAVVMFPVLAAWILLSVAVPACLTYAPVAGWAVAILSAATVGAVTWAAVSLAVWVELRWS